MNTRLITVLIILLLAWVGYRTYVYYGKVQTETQQTSTEDRRKNARPKELPGMPYQLEPSLNAAKNNGPAALKQWLETYAPQIRDPRKAAIQLDYCTMVARANPQEARRVFAEVKARIQPQSPVYPRMKQLEKSLE